jgi:hypothetical protein
MPSISNHKLNVEKETVLPVLDLNVVCRELLLEISPADSLMIPDR